MIGRSPEIVLKDAAVHLEQNGWCKNFFKDTDGRSCMVGAVMAVSPSTSPGWIQERMHALEILRRRIGITNDTLENWNDAPGRTKDEVLRVLRGE